MYAVAATMATPRPPHPSNCRPATTRFSTEKNRFGPSFQNQNKTGTSASATPSWTRPKIRAEVNIPGTTASTAIRTAGNNTAVITIQTPKKAATPFQPRFIGPS